MSCLNFPRPSHTVKNKPLVQPGQRSFRRYPHRSPCRTCTAEAIEPPSSRKQARQPGGSDLSMWLSPQCASVGGHFVLTDFHPLAPVRAVRLEMFRTQGTSCITDCRWAAFHQALWLGTDRMFVRSNLTSFGSLRQDSLKLAKTKAHAKLLPASMHQLSTRSTLISWTLESNC